jgi:pSer/pThr/pTyr-binding forkhead associated (FHA) protein
LPVTHILYGGDSMRFPESGLVIGTEEVSNTPHITLPRAAAGVSRRHCSLRREGERTVLIDHSRYGTWINGARVRERAAVRPGDRVRVGHARRRVHADLGRGLRRRVMRKRRAFEVFTLSFLDCICCGFGAVVLFYTIVQAQAGAQEIQRLDELTGEVRKLEEEVLVGQKNLVLLRNTLEKTDEDAGLGQGARAARGRRAQAVARDLGERGRDPRESASTSTS